MLDWLQDPNSWAALLTLTLLEIVLGIDNIVFLSILVDRLPRQRRKSARLIGLALAMLTRLMLLATLKWIMGLDSVLFQIPLAPCLWKMVPAAAEHAGMLGVSGKDLILLGGGIFLLFKSTKEIHHALEGGDEDALVTGKAASFPSILLQIALIDIIFSLDSVITAVGMADHLAVMALAVILAVGVMMLASGSISSFVSRHRSVKMLALAFLILIGTALMAEGLHFHIPKGYIYFAMAFSLGVEMLNLKARARRAAAAPA